MRSDIRRVSGVAQVRTRIVVEVTLDVPGLAEPAIGRVVSIPERRAPMLNDLQLVRGHYVDARLDRPGTGQRSLRHGQQARSGRQDWRRAEWPLEGTRDRRHRAVPRVHLRGRQRHAVSRQQALRCAVDGQGGAGSRLRHGGGIQRCGAVPLRRCTGAGRHRCPRCPAAALWRTERLWPQRPALESLPVGRTGRDRHHDHVHSWTVPCRRLVPAVRRAVTTGGDATHGNRPAQGLWPLEPAGGPALPVPRHGDRRHRPARRAAAGGLPGWRVRRCLQGLLPLPGSAPRRQPAPGADCGCRQHVGRGSRRLGGREARSGPPACRSDAPGAACQLPRRA